MKSKLLMILAIAFAVSQQTTSAQLPEVSTNLEHSSTNKTVWYVITCAKPEFAGKCLTYIPKTNDYADQIEMKDFQENNDNQLWKLVKQGTLTNLVNKATGSIIQPSSTVVEPDNSGNYRFNLIQFVLSENESTGWKLTSLGSKQYSISAKEEDDITRYMNATADNSSPEEYDGANVLNSAFAWQFRQNVATSLIAIQEIDDARVYVENKRIVVEGVDTFTVRTIQGITVNENLELPNGVYLVTINGKTVKVLVN